MCLSLCVGGVGEPSPVRVEDVGILKQRLPGARKLGSETLKLYGVAGLGGEERWGRPLPLQLLLLSCAGQAKGPN